MRRSLTLLELIFSMVIIAIAFTVLPKMMQLATRASMASIKEEALYNAIAYMGLIKSMAWDENNTLYDDILLVENGNNVYECNQNTGYRVGGFVGSRNCLHHKSASALGSDGEDGSGTPYDDIDDFQGERNASNVERGGTRNFKLDVKINYITDIAPNEDRFSTTTSAQSTNTKRIDINITTSNARYGADGGTISLGHIYYYGFNIGQIKINRYPWR